MKKTTLKNSNLKLALESLESRKLCAVDLAVGFHAADIAGSAMASPAIYDTRRLAADVDGDGRVSPIDALRVIDALNRIGTSRPASVGEGEQAPIGSLDANKDGSLNPIDVLVVIDALNAFEGVVTTAFEGFEVTAFGDYEATAYETDVVFEEFENEFETEFDFDWVKRGGSNEELPLFFGEHFSGEHFSGEHFSGEHFSGQSFDLFSEQFAMEFAELLTEEFPEFSELYATYATIGAGSASGMDVAMFSQNGPLGHVMRKNMVENADLEPAVVSYFSSNFLRGFGL